MPSPQTIVVVDENASGRFLLVWTLRRKFPRCLVTECDDADVAIAMAAAELPDVFVVHRAPGFSCIDLVRAIRGASPSVPIIAVSGHDRSREAAAAGATRFLNYDHWKKAGSVVGEAIAEVSALLNQA